MINVLFISPDFNYVCGVSKYVHLLLKELSQRKELNLFFITNKGDSLDRLSGMKVKIDFIDFKRGNKNPFKILMELYILRKYCLQNKIDIIHSHHRYPELLAYLLSKMMDIKTITTVLSFVEGNKILSFKSEKIIAVSNAISKYLQNQFHVLKNKIVMMHFFLENVAYQHQLKNIIKKEVFGIIDNCKIILFVGRVNQIKGFDILIDAIARIEKLNEEVRFFVVGDLDSKKFFNLYQGKGMIHYYGPQSDVINFYSIADIVVLPSRIDPFPFVMLEAGLAKKAFIGGRTGGIEEFIEDGVDGLLVEPGNTEDLYNKIIYLLNDSNLQKTLGENLYNKVLSLTNKEAYIQKLLSIYEELLQSRS